MLCRQYPLRLRAGCRNYREAQKSGGAIGRQEDPKFPVLSAS
jgi:hypothetical protein